LRQFWDQKSGAEKDRSAIKTGRQKKWRGKRSIGDRGGTTKKWRGKRSVGDKSGTTKKWRGDKIAAPL